MTKKTKCIWRRGIAITAVLAMSLTLLAGCSKSTAPATTGAAPTSDSDLAGAVGKPVSTYGGYLGYGYDILWGDYFCEKDVDASHCVLDMDSLAAAGYVREANMDSTSINYFYSASIKDVFSYVAEGSIAFADTGFAGIAGAYAHSTDEYEFEDQFHMFTNCEVITKRQLIDGATVSRLKDYLTEGFKEDVVNLSASDLIDTYGIYVLTDIQLGGRMGLLYCLENSGKYTDEEMLSIIIAYYEEKGIDADDSNTDAAAAKGDLYDEGKSEYEKCKKIKIRTYGGKVKIKPSSLSSAMDNFEPWQQSVQDGAEAFVDARSGLPIWELAETVDADKAAAIKAEFENRVSNLWVVK